MRTKAFAIPLMALIVLASACGGVGKDNGSGNGGSTGGSGGTGGTGRIEHPTGRDDLVLRVFTGGGFVALQANLRAIPQVSIYGDGRMIVQGPVIEIYPGPALANLQVSQLSEEAVQAILAAAKDAGLLGPDADYPYPCVADLPTTTFTVNAGGSTHTVSAYALQFGSTTGASGGSGSEPGASGGSGVAGSSGTAGSSGVTSSRGSTGSADAVATGSMGSTGGCGGNTEARARLSAFEAKLTSLSAWLPSGSIGPEQPYAPTEMRLYVSAYQPDPQLTQETVTWPLDQPLASFGEPDANLGDLRCGVVSGNDLQTLLPLAEAANELTPWRSGHHEYGIVFRPLLPDEHTC